MANMDIKMQQKATGAGGAFCQVCPATQDEACSMNCAAFQNRFQERRSLGFSKNMWILFAEPNEEGILAIDQKIPTQDRFGQTQEPKVNLDCHD